MGNAARKARKREGGKFIHPTKTPTVDYLKRKQGQPDFEHGLMSRLMPGLASTITNYTRR